MQFHLSYSGSVSSLERSIDQGTVALIEGCQLKTTFQREPWEIDILTSLPYLILISCQDSRLAEPNYKLEGYECVDTVRMARLPAQTAGEEE